ncbi:NAD(P)-binding domain-containing protein [Streptomyces durbertensis]|uniref:NAD(P)-binding domain-containing protein n=1 Tax=Streptomyces durbertensis TaxID=2448886 RepID=A0ABR6ECG0_9ACTN|nr:NAD(P)-binding domain-containing protein [Streptomyces durbertensis]MBB1243007.1 NAD(P)-binding domain-containing protein [Streptomyces durbertensis]
MKIAVLGTGAGARCHIAALSALGHEVVVGTRDPHATSIRSAPDMTGTPPFPVFHAEHPEVGLTTFAEAADAAELVINGIDGANAVAALSRVPDDALAGKTLVDYAVPYEYDPDVPHPWPTPWGVMPRLTVCDTDSLAERIQRAHPDARVVKAFVTQEQETVVGPGEFGGGDHTMLIAGDHQGAKEQVTEVLHGYGWRDVLDLGDLHAARGMEMYAHLHCAIGLALGGRRFGVKIVR